jgi:ATP-dependent DNA helicase Q1
LIKKYLKEEYQQTAYSTNSYIAAGQLAPRFIHETRERIVQAATPVIEMTVVNPVAKTKPRRKKNVDDSGDCEDVTPPSKKRRTTAVRKGKEKDVDDHEDLDDMYMPDITSTNGVSSYQSKQGKTAKVGARTQRYGDYDPTDDGAETINLDFPEDDSDSDVSYDWSHSIRVSPPVTRPRRAVKSILDREVLVLSD